MPKRSQLVRRLMREKWGDFLPRTIEFADGDEVKSEGQR